MNNYYQTPINHNFAKIMSKEECLDYLQHHSIQSFDQQTGVIDGELCEYGTSFAEQVGIKDVYTVKEVKEWLGY